jgi:hypothetical protein
VPVAAGLRTYGPAMALAPGVNVVSAGGLFLPADEKATEGGPLVGCRGGEAALSASFGSYVIYKATGGAGKGSTDSGTSMPLPVLEERLVRGARRDRRTSHVGTAAVVRCAVLVGETLVRRGKL